MRGNHDNAELMWAFDLHAFRKEGAEQQVSFYHDLVSPGQTVKQALLEIDVETTSCQNRTESAWGAGRDISITTRHAAASQADRDI